MKIATLLTEKVRKQNVYHGTPLPTAINIIHADKLSANTTQEMKQGNTINKKIYNGVSTSRDLNVARAFSSNYQSGWDKPMGWIIFELDYEKIKQTNKVTPYDYWYNEENRAERKYNEIEEFVIGSITPLQKYIVNIFADKSALYLLNNQDKLIQAYNNYFGEEADFINENSINSCANKIKQLVKPYPNLILYREDKNFFKNILK